MTDEELKPLPASIAKLTKCELLRLAVIKHNESVGLRSENQRLVASLRRACDYIEAEGAGEFADSLRAAIEGK